MRRRILASIAILLTVGCITLNEVKPAQADTDNSTYNNNSSESSSEFAASIITFFIFAGGFALALPEIERKRVGKEVAVKVDQIMNFKAGDKEYVKDGLKVERILDSDATHINVYFKDKSVYKASYVVEHKVPEIFPTSNLGIQKIYSGNARIEVKFMEFDKEWFALSKSVEKNQTM